MGPPPTDGTNATKPGEESGVFPIVDFSEVDLDRILTAAIRAVADQGVPSVMVRSAPDAGAAIVFGTRNKLEAAITRVLHACVRTTMSGTTLRVALRRQATHWSIRVQHYFTHQDESLAAELDASLTFAHRILVAHDGSVDVLTDRLPRARVITLSLRAEGEP